jgi:hypothetical protein
MIVRPSSAITNSGNITTLDAPLTENFNTLATGGTANPWSDNSTIGGMYAQFAAVPTNPTAYIADAGGNNTGGIHSYGTGTNTERALGSVGSNTTGDIFFGFKLTNSTGNTITSLDVSYVGEQWRNGGNTAAQQLDFQYRVENTGVVTDINTPSSAWLDFNMLDFVSPVVGATAAALDGNAAANRTAKSDTVTLTAAPGQVWRLMISQSHRMAVAASTSQSATPQSPKVMAARRRRRSSSVCPRRLVQAASRSTFLRRTTLPRRATMITSGRLCSHRQSRRDRRLTTSTSLLTAT